MQCDVTLIREDPDNPRLWMETWIELHQVSGCLDLIQLNHYDEVYLFTVKEKNDDEKKSIAGFVLIETLSSKNKSNTEVIKYISQICTADSYKQKGFAKYMVSNVLKNSGGHTVGAFAVNDVSKDLFMKLGFVDYAENNDAAYKLYLEYDIYVNCVKRCENPLNCGHVSKPSICTTNGGKLRSRRKPASKASMKRS
jgi:ribosomal protein S18 acetylase RimI-like enzyme